MKTEECCRWCGSTEKDDIAKDGSGFWCADCDGFTYYDNEKNKKHRMLLILESEKGIYPDMERRHKLKKRISPLRYPGGKSKIAHWLLMQTQPWQMDSFVEVFAGGASVGLSLLDAGRIKKLLLNDADPNVYAFWKAVLYAPDSLIRKIKETVPDREAFFSAKERLKEDITDQERAWCFFLINRTAFSGIQMANPMMDITARWNPADLVKRIRRIASMKEQITLYNMDACDFMEQYAYWTEKTTLFLDPPYYKKGNLLYPCAYTMDGHKALADMANSLYAGFDGPDMIVTYDDCPEIEYLYPWADILRIHRSYSCRCVKKEEKVWNM